MKTMRRTTLIVTVCFTGLCPLFAQEAKTSNAPFLTPPEAVAAMDIPEGFDVSIFASEPDIGEAIAFTFDDRGRIWVVENYNYVNRGKHKTEELSRIQILDDTNSDGIFDTKTLFADKLGFSSGIAVGFGGVYLGSPPSLLFIPDADGDDVPDGAPEVLLDGWGIHDRHETLNSFIWGPDGWLYGCHGVFTRSLVGKPGAAEEDRQYLDAGIWRFHPVRKEFEIFARGLSNSWGFDFNDVGHGFATACVIPHLFHVVQGGIYHKQSVPHVNPYAFDGIKTIRDHTHRSAHGDARFYLADTFPPKYREQLFMCNIHQHTVLTDIMEPKGSSYIGRHGEDFLPTNDLAWVGFSVEIGPEGGVYILDWHDTDICGNSVNFPDTGRIYRIMPKGAERIERPDIGRASDLQLVALQDHSNDWYVRLARVQLQQRAAAGTLDKNKVHPALNQYFKRTPTSAKRLRALWAMHVTDYFEGARQSELVELLSHSDENIRSWTVQLLCEKVSPSETVREKFLEMAQNDPSPVVRLYLAAALQRMPVAQRWPIIGALAQHSEDVEDSTIPRMLWFALEPGVVESPEQALTVAVEGNIPYLQESVARRMVIGSSLGGSGKGGKGGSFEKKWAKILDTVAPGFFPVLMGKEGVTLLDSFRNETVVQTSPDSKGLPFAMTREMHIPRDKQTTLKARVSYQPHGAWNLQVVIGKEVIASHLIDYETVQDEWFDLEVDLSEYAGKQVDVTLLNGGDQSGKAFAYWKSVEIISE